MGEPEPTTTGAVVEGDPHIHTFEGETLGASLGVGKKMENGRGFSYGFSVSGKTYICIYIYYISEITNIMIIMIRNIVIYV